MVESQSTPGAEETPSPRISPLDAGKLSDDALALTTQLRQAFSLPTNEIPKVVATMIRHLELYRAQVDYVSKRSRALVGEPRVHELAILRISWLCRSPFLWGEHVKLAKRAGLTSEEIDRVTRGPTDPAWGAFERAVLKAVDELREDATISDPTWSVLAGKLNDKELIELISLIGSHQEVSYIYNSLRIELMPGNPGLLAR